MENKYITENQAALDKLIEAMTHAFKTAPLTFKMEAVKSDEVVVVKKKVKLRRFGVAVNNEGDQYIHKNIQVFKDYLLQKYSLGKWEAEQIATDIICQYVLKIVYEKANLEFLSNYEQYQKKRLVYSYLKVGGFLLLIVLILLFFILT